MSEFAGPPKLVYLCVGVHWRTSVISTSIYSMGVQHVFFLLLMQFVWWEVSGQITVVFMSFTKHFPALLSSSHLDFDLRRFVKVQLVKPYSRTNTVIAWTKTHFILSERSNVHLVFKLWITVCDFPLPDMISHSVDEILIPKYLNSPTNFYDLAT